MEEQKRKALEEKERKLNKLKNEALEDKLRHQNEINELQKKHEEEMLRMEKNQEIEKQKQLNLQKQAEQYYIDRMNEINKKKNNIDINEYLILYLYATSTTIKTFFSDNREN